METTIYTPRLKLTLVTTAERGSREFEWLHELRSDEKVTWWSIYGRSKSPEETEKVIKHILPVPDLADGQKVYRVVYVVHEILETADKQSDPKDAPTRLAGSITIRSQGPNDLPIPPSMFPISSVPSSTTLNAELGYQFLPSAWGKGFATESVSAVFEACRRASSFWTPFQNVYVRALVNAENPASLRVMAKSGMEERGVYVWTGEPVYLAGEWRGRGDLHIFGMYLKGGENM